MSPPKNSIPCKRCQNKFVPHRAAKECAECSSKMFCNICSVETVKNWGRGKIWCSACSIKETHTKYTEKNKDEWVECRNCGHRGKEIANHLIIAHNINPEDYGLTKSKVMCDIRRGEKNPAYNHGGHLSPFSKKFLKYSDKTDSEKEKAILDTVGKAKNSRDSNNNDNTRKSYYISRGSTEEEAKQAVRERQITFSLEKCVERYGEELGKLVWKDRQDRWQKTLNARPQELIDSTNKRKSSKFTYRKLWNNELSDPGKFYILEVEENLYKIGITSREITQRYSSSKLRMFEPILVKDADNISHAFRIEQIIKRKYFATINKDNKKYNIGWTEIIRANRQELLEQVQYLLENCGETHKLIDEIRRNRA